MLGYFDRQRGVAALTRLQRFELSNNTKRNLHRA